MLTLTEYINHSNGTYSCVMPTSETSIKIQQYINDNNIQSFNDAGEILPIAKFHTTICYSKTPVPSVEYLDIKLPVIANFKQFSLFGENKDVLVIELHSNELQRVFNESKKRGATSDWGEFSPHITIAKNIKSDSLISTLEDIKFDFMFDRYVCSPLKESD